MTTITDITCQRCGAHMQWNSAYNPNNVAVCPTCKTVFQAVDGDGHSAPAPNNPRALEVTREPYGADLTIHLRWFEVDTGEAKFWIVFALLWNLCMVIWVARTVSLSGWDATAQGTVHVLVGMALLYFAATKWLNITTITATHEALSVRHGSLPLPWHGNKRINMAQVAQVYCTEKVKRGRIAVHRTYSLSIITPDGHEGAFMEGLKKPELALSIQREMEQYLRLIRQTVSAEVPCQS